MNPSTAILSTEMILAWTLLGVLLAWMLFCVFLTLRPYKVEERETADLSTLPGSFSLKAPQQAVFHVSSSSLDVLAGDISVAPAESDNDVGVAPVA